MAAWNLTAGDRSLGVGEEEKEEAAAVTFWECLEQDCYSFSSSTMGKHQKEAWPTA